MVKVFISQPMNGRTEADIQEQRAQVTEKLKLQFGDGNIEVLDTYFKDVDASVAPLWCLGESIKLMTEADVVFFCRGWDHSRGCVIEHKCAEAYGIVMLEEG